MGQTQTTQLPHDIYGLALYPAGLSWWMWYAGIVVLVAAGCGIYWLIANRKRSVQTVVVDPWKVLRDELRALAPTSPFDRQRQTDFYFHLSHAVRLVIERRTSLRATDMTTRELREPLNRKVPLPSESLSRMQSFFERADLVKFADVEATLKQAEEDYRDALLWFEKLRPLSIHQDTMLFTGEEKGEVVA